MARIKHGLAHTHKESDKRGGQPGGFRVRFHRERYHVVDDYHDRNLQSRLGISISTHKIHNQQRGTQKNNNQKTKNINEGPCVIKRRFNNDGADPNSTVCPSGKKEYETGGGRRNLNWDEIGRGGVWLLLHRHVLTRGQTCFTGAKRRESWGWGAKQLAADMKSRQAMTKLGIYRSFFFFLFTEFSVVVCVVQNQVEVRVRFPLGSVLEWSFLLDLFPYYTFILFWYKNYVRLCGNVYRTEKNPHRIDKWSNQ